MGKTREREEDHGKVGSMKREEVKRKKRRRREEEDARIRADDLRRLGPIRNAELQYHTKLLCSGRQFRSAVTIPKPPRWISRLFGHLKLGRASAASDWPMAPHPPLGRCSVMTAYRTPRQRAAMESENTPKSQPYIISAPRDGHRKTCSNY